MPQSVELGKRIAAEQENLFSALNWAIDIKDVDLAFRLLRACPGPGNQVGLAFWAPVEGVLALPGAAEHPDQPYGLALAAIRAAHAGDRERSEELCDAALAAVQRHGPNPTHDAEFAVSVARNVLAFAVGDWHSAAVHSELTAELGRAAGQVPWVVSGLSGAATCYVMAGDADAAVPLATEGLPLAREQGMPYLIRLSLGALAAALVDRDPTRAESLLRESTAMSVEGDYEIQNELVHGVLVAGRLRDAPLVLQLAEPAVRHLHWSGDRAQLAGVLNVAAWAISAVDPDAAATIQGAARALALAGTPVSAAADTIDPDVKPTAQAEAPTPRGYLTELRRETTGYLAGVLGDTRLRELRAQGEVMDADQVVAHVLAHIDQADVRPLEQRS